MSLIVEGARRKWRYWSEAFRGLHGVGAPLLREKYGLAMNGLYRCVQSSDLPHKGYPCKEGCLPTPDDTGCHHCDKCGGKAGDNWPDDLQVEIEGVGASINLPPTDCVQFGGTCEDYNRTLFFGFWPRPPHTCFQTPSMGHSGVGGDIGGVHHGIPAGTGTHGISAVDYPEFGFFHGEFPSNFCNVRPMGDWTFASNAGEHTYVRMRDYQGVQEIFDDPGASFFERNYPYQAAGSNEGGTDTPPYFLYGQMNITCQGPFDNQGLPAPGFGFGLCASHWMDEHGVGGMIPFHNCMSNARLVSEFWPEKPDCMRFNRVPLTVHPTGNLSNQCCNLSQVKMYVTTIKFHDCVHHGVPPSNEPPPEPGTPLGLHTHDFFRDMVSYWPLLESSGTRADHMGEHPTGSHPLTASSSDPAYADGYFDFGGGVDLESSSSQYLERAGTSAGDLIGDSGDWTFAAWVKPESRVTGARVVSVWPAMGTSNRSWLIDIQRSGSSRFWSVGINTTLTRATDTDATNCVVGEWAHIVAQHRDGVDVRIKINNGPWHVTPHTAGIAAVTTSAVNFRLGGIGTFFDGEISEVGFWKRQLVDHETQELYISQEPLMSVATRVGWYS